ncbi:hypothetical protein RAD15_33275, partial [Bradyrhizobium sp. 14AA]
AAAALTAGRRRAVDAYGRKNFLADRIATQRWIQTLNLIDLIDVFVLQYSLRSGFTAYVALSPGSDALLPPSPCE